MIHSAEEFVALRQSDDLAEQRRATTDNAEDATWFDVILRYPDMREWVALNKTTSVEVLRVLSGDPDARVRYAVAMVRRLPENVFDALSHDADPSIRMRIALNGKVPVNILERLVNDHDADVAKAAQERVRERRPRNGR